MGRYWKAEALIKQIAPHYLDESVVITCPFCQQDWEDQGKPNDWKPKNSCKITRIPAGLLYICYRASCAKHGIVYDSVKSIEQLNTPTPKFVPKYVTQETHELDGSTWMRYQAVRNKQYGLHLSTLREQGIVYAPSNDRLYMPVYDAFGKQLGHIAKAVATDKEPKVLTLKTEPAPWLHFPLHQTHSHRVILVEDIISSIKVAQTGFMVGALLGTHVSNDMILLLKAMGIREVIFMLDPDATGKAAKFVSNYSPYFSSVRLIPLTKGDPKEYTIEELHEAIN